MCTDHSGLSEKILTSTRVVADFPSPGVDFLDIGTLVSKPSLFMEVNAALAAPYKTENVTHVLGIEARGLYFAGTVASILGAGLVPVRKPGKLPKPVRYAKGAIRDREQVVGLSEINSHRPTTYQKPYEFELSVMAIGPQSRVVVVDDLLAKGGSTQAVQQLVKDAGAELVGASYVIELKSLGGRNNLPGLPIQVLAEYS